MSPHEAGSINLQHSIAHQLRQRPMLLLHPKMHWHMLQ